MATKTRTAADLYADYAHRIAAVTGLNATDYEPTASHMAALLRDTAERLGSTDQNRDVLDELASYLDAAALLNGPHAQDVLRTVDNTLHEVVAELETC
jgi:hypothetical protein